jgi:predicted nucleic acid-binding protein
MLDTMIFDGIVGTWGLTRRIRRLVSSGALTILTTHIQEDQLAEVRSRWKRVRIARIPRVSVPTSEFVIGYSRLGRARLGTGEPFETIRSTPTHTKDGLIGATASREGVILVTEDRRLTSRASAAGVTVWNFGQFRTWVNQSQH